MPRICVCARVIVCLCVHRMIENHSQFLFIRKHLLFVLTEWESGRRTENLSKWLKMREWTKCCLFFIARFHSMDYETITENSIASTVSSRCVSINRPALSVSAKCMRTTHTLKWVRWKTISKRLSSTNSNSQLNTKWLHVSIKLGLRFKWDLRSMTGTNF